MVRIASSALPATALLLLAACHGGQTQENAATTPRDDQAGLPPAAPNEAIPNKTIDAQDVKNETVGDTATTRTPRASLPLGETTPEGARKVAGSYVSLVLGNHLADAVRLWRTGDQSRATQARTTAVLRGHPGTTADVGQATNAEGAAGSLYVEVPVTVHYRAKDQPQSRAGKIILRRANDVPGATAEQRSWRIVDARFADLPGAAE